jgi:ASCH domain
VTKNYALSLKQPWATLLVHGRKSIEVRSWTTRRRGRVLIHAARAPDPRPEAWAQVPLELREAAQLGGGVIGAADLTEVRIYRTPHLFVADQARHLNDPSWFKPPYLYGFVFANPHPLPFRLYPGNVRFFTVEDG